MKMTWKRIQGGHYESDKYMLKWSRYCATGKTWDVFIGDEKVNMFAFRSLREAKVRAELHSQGAK